MPVVMPAIFTSRPERSPVIVTEGSRGVIGADAWLAGPQPWSLRASTVKVYAVPLTKPVTVQPGAVDVHEPPGGLDVTRYSRIGLDPELEGAVHVTVA